MRAEIVEQKGNCYVCSRTIYRPSGNNGKVWYFVYQTEKAFMVQEHQSKKQAMQDFYDFA